MHILKHITNGALLIVIGVLHTRLAVSPDGFGRQFSRFSDKLFFKISSGLDELPGEVGRTNFESFAAFWFFYFGILLVPLGILVHSIEREGRVLPRSFSISYLFVVLIGCYMMPNSGMTFFMLPHALYMLIRGELANRKIQ